MQVTLKGLKLSAIATALPEQKLRMAKLYKQFGKREVVRTISTTGISSVRVAQEGINASDLCLAATQHLFEKTKISNKSIDAIIFVSETPDYKTPATSCILQDRLKLNTSVVAFDINYGCSGYIYGLYQAALLVATQSAQRVLVCVGDTISRYLDPDDHQIRLALGDAGSASIVESGTDDWAFDINTDGSGFDNLIIPKESHIDGYLHMNDEAIMEFVIREVDTSFEKVLTRQKWNKADIKQAVLHQPNEFILNYLRNRLDFSNEQMPITARKYGNTGGASIPLTLCENEESKDLGKTILSGFGAGFSWGAIALNLSGAELYKPIFLSLKELATYGC